jgi:hypothetical protein
VLLVKPPVVPPGTIHAPSPSPPLPRPTCAQAASQAFTLNLLIDLLTASRNGVERDLEEMEGERDAARDAAVRATSQVRAPGVLAVEPYPGGCWPGCGRLSCGPGSADSCSAPASPAGSPRRRSPTTAINTPVTTPPLPSPLPGAPCRRRRCALSWLRPSPAWTAPTWSWWQPPSPMAATRCACALHRAFGSGQAQHSPLTLLVALGRSSDLRGNVPKLPAG